VCGRCRLWMPGLSGLHVLPEGCGCGLDGDRVNPELHVGPGVVCIPWMETVDCSAAQRWMRAREQPDCKIGIGLISYIKVHLGNPYLPMYVGLVRMCVVACPAGRLQTIVHIWAKVCTKYAGRSASQARCAPQSTYIWSTFGLKKID